MPIALNTYSLRKQIASGDISFENDSFISLLSDLQIDGVELWANHIEAQGWDESTSNFKEFTDKLSEHAIVPFSICVENGLVGDVAPEYGSDAAWISSVKEINMDRFAYGEMYMDLASEMHIPFVRFCFGPGFYGYKKSISKALEFNLELATSLYSGLCDLEHDPSVQLCIENHSFITADPIFIGKLLDAIPSLKVTLDLGNLPDDKAPFIQEVTSRNRLGYVHAKMHEWAEGSDLREKYINYHGLIENLKKTNFSGYYSIEWDGKDGNIYENLKKSVKLLKNSL